MANSAAVQVGEAPLLVPDPAENAPPEPSLPPSRPATCESMAVFAPNGRRADPLFLMPFCGGGWKLGTGSHPQAGWR